MPGTMLLLANLLAVLLAAVVPLRAASTGAELQRLEKVMEEMATNEQLQTEPSSTGKRTVREEPKIDPLEPSSSPAEVTELGSMTARQNLPWASGRSKEETPPQGHTDSRFQKHFSSGFPSSVFGSSSYPNLNFNVHSPHVSAPVQLATATAIGAPPIGPARPFGQSPVSPICGPCGTQNVQLHETHFATQHMPQTYTATVPFIAGYRLTPVVGQKHITLNDWATAAGAGAASLAGFGSVGSPGLGPAAGLWGTRGGAWGGGWGSSGAWGGPWGLGSGCATDWPGYYQTIYGGYARDTADGVGPDGKPVVMEEDVRLWPEDSGLPPAARFQGPPQSVPVPPEGFPIPPHANLSPEELLKPFETARFFQPPLDMDHGLQPHRSYQQHITDMRHQIEHLESLRDNAPLQENVIPKS